MAMTLISMSVGRIFRVCSVCDVDGGPLLARVELEGPGVALQELFCRSLELPVGGHPDSGSFKQPKRLLSDWTLEEVLVVILRKLITCLLSLGLSIFSLDLDVLQDGLALVGHARLNQHRVLHEVTADLAEEIIRHLKVFDNRLLFTLENLLYLFLQLSNINLRLRLVDLVPQHDAQLLES